MDIPDLDKEQTYVIYCTWGMQAPMVAEVMQQYGYDAYALKGGIDRLRHLVDSRPERRGAGA